jgi:hypothetical protein
MQINWLAAIIEKEVDADRLIIGADIAKNDRSVQRLRQFHDNAAERSVLTDP